MYSIQKYNDIDRAEWARFVEMHPKGNVFQTPEMYDVYSCTKNTRPLVVAIHEGNEIVGLILAQILTNGGILTSWLTARSIIIGGPLVKEDNPKVLELLLREYNKRLPTKVIYSEIRPIYDIESIGVQLVQNHWRRNGHYNLVLSLDKSEEELFAQMHKERRRNVNQAKKAGLEFRELMEIEDVHQVVALIEKTYRRKHVPIGYLNIFDEVYKYMSQYAYFFGTYTVEGKMIAGEVRLCFGDLVYAWFAGSDEEYFKLRPNDFTMWNVIRWARDKGYKWFDFGGGGEPGKPYGVRDYKLKYGCEMYDYGRYIFARRPILYWAAATTYNLYHKLKGK